MESLVTGCVALSDFIREIAVYSAFKKESLPKIEKSGSIFHPESFWTAYGRTRLPA